MIGDGLAAGTGCLSPLAAPSRRAVRHPAAPSPRGQTALAVSLATMARTELTPVLQRMISAVRSLANDLEVPAVIVISDIAYDFQKIRTELEPHKLLVASHLPDVQQAATEDGVVLVPLLHEPQTRQVQVSQALLEAIADDHLQTGARVIAIYAAYDRDNLDTISIINLSEHLTKLTSRDLQRLRRQARGDAVRRRPPSPRPRTVARAGPRSVPRLPAEGPDDLQPARPREHQGAGASMRPPPA
jgi:hypothetical protein